MEPLQVRSSHQCASRQFQRQPQAQPRTGSRHRDESRIPRSQRRRLRQNARRFAEPMPTLSANVACKPRKFGGSPLKITRIETVVVNAVHRNWIFVKVLTDQTGLHGWGEATLEWKTRAVKGAIDDLAPFVIGQD